MEGNKLYMLLLGCRPPGRFTEQHDIFFGIGTSLHDLLPAIKESWPEAKGNIHLDAWRLVTQVDGYDINIVSSASLMEEPKSAKSLFFINLGGYKENEFEEYHYKLLVVAEDMESAKKAAKVTAFYKHVSIKGAPSHIDEKYGVDADDMHQIDDILPTGMREKFRISLSPASTIYDDENHLGYLPIYKIKK